MGMKLYPRISSHKCCPPMSFRYDPPSWFNPLTRLSVLCVVCLMLMGCGGRKQGIVSGNVMYQGKALNSGLVSFILADGIPITVEIQPDGSYQTPKIIFGEAIVTVIQRPAGFQSPAEIAKAGRGQNQVIQPMVPLPETLLPRKYLDANSTPLRCVVDRAKVDFSITLED